MFSSQPFVIVLIGPTASGKTALAIEIANYFKTNIHNIDSRQIYRFMDIGTAKVTWQQREIVEHHLIDIKTGEIIEFVDDEIEKLQKKVAEKYGYKLVDHKLELYGVKKNK